MRAWLLGEDGIEGRRIARRAELGGDRRIAQHARNPCQCLQMVGAGRLGGEQQKNEVDRRRIGGGEIDRFFEPRENSEEQLALCKLAMRQRDPVADSGRAESLALQQRVEDLARWKVGNTRRPLAQFLQHLLLGIDPQRCDDRLGR